MPPKKGRQTSGPLFALLRKPINFICCAPAVCKGHAGLPKTENDQGDPAFFFIKQPSHVAPLSANWVRNANGGFLFGLAFPPYKESALKTKLFFGNQCRAALKSDSSNSTLPYITSEYFW